MIIRVITGRLSRGRRLITVYHPLNATAVAICAIAKKQSLSRENLATLHQAGAVIAIMKCPFGESPQGRDMTSWDGRPLPSEALEADDPPERVYEGVA